MVEECEWESRGKGMVLVCAVGMERNVDCGCHLDQERVCGLMSLNLASSARAIAKVAMSVVGRLKRSSLLMSCCRPVMKKLMRSCSETPLTLFMSSFALWIIIKGSCKMILQISQKFFLSCE